MLKLIVSFLKHFLMDEEFNTVIFGSLVTICFASYKPTTLTSTTHTSMTLTSMTLTSVILTSMTLTSVNITSMTLKARPSQA